MTKSIKIFGLYLCGLLISAPVAECLAGEPAVLPGSKSGHKVIWGASSAQFPGETCVDGVASWERLNSRIKSYNNGFGLHARRSYDRAIPASFAASAMAPDVNLCKVSIGSFKPSWQETAEGTNHAAMKQFIQSIPDKHEVYLVFHHEPEDEALEGRSGRNPELLQKAFAKFVDIVLTSEKPNVHPCFVLMSWTFKTKSKRNPDDFNLAKYLKPEQLKEVIAGIDGYADDPSVSAKEVFEPGLAKIATWGFTRFGIFETGAHASSVATARSAWINGLGQWANSRTDIELVSWFNNGNGQHAGPTGWYLGNWHKDGTTYSWDDTDGTIKAYSKLLEQN